ncbi:MAG: hypothetical protein VX424_23630 [Actinomycetota bacterium]|nr:hypothetical protein [Actinomycetota bacterium]
MSTDEPNIWQKMPVWARLIVALLGLAVVALLPSAGQGVVINVATIGFVAAVVWAIIRTVAKQRR